MNRELIEPTNAVRAGKLSAAALYLRRLGLVRPQEFSGLL